MRQEAPETVIRDDKLGRDSPKFNDSLSFITMIVGKFRDLVGKAAKASGCDSSPDAAAKTGIMVVPHESVSQLHEEYVCYRKAQEVHPDSIAELGTFSKAYGKMEKEGHIRLLGCKGSFPTCDICNNCNDLLRNANRKNRPEDLEVILNFKRAHLSQQELERRHMDYVQDICKTLDSSGNPNGLYICPDAMTEHRTVVPKEHTDSGRKSKEQNFLTNRIMGVVVTCGPHINTKMLIHLDGFVGGGANLMVEVMRQVIKEVGKLLAAKGQCVPKTMYWQMDNCGENKNKGFYLKQILIE